MGFLTLDSASKQAGARKQYAEEIKANIYSSVWSYSLFFQLGCSFQNWLVAQSYLEGREK